jgi:hypothetical protein
MVHVGLFVTTLSLLLYQDIAMLALGTLTPFLWDATCK